MALKSAVKATLTAAVVASAAALCPGTAHAITGPASFQIGDKLFNSFSCSGVAALCDSVSYEPVPGGSFGVRYNPGLTNTTPNTTLDVLLGFHVSVVGGAAKITDFHLSSNAAATGSGSVVDTLEVCTTQICTPATTVIGPGAPLLLTVPPPGGINFSGNIPGGPYSELWIYDDVAVSVGATAGVASISRTR